VRTLTVNLLVATGQIDHGKVKNGPGTKLSRKFLNILRSDEERWFYDVRTDV